MITKPRVSRNLHATLRWRYNDSDGVSNHQPHDCLLNCLFGRISKKTSKLHVTGLCVGNSPGPVNSPHKGPVTRKMFPFDDVIMNKWKNMLSRPVTRKMFPFDDVIMNKWKNMLSRPCHTHTRTLRFQTPRNITISPLTGPAQRITPRSLRSD